MTDAVADCDDDDVGLGVTVALADCVPDGLWVSDDERVALGVPVALGLSVCEGDCVGDGEDVPLPVELGVCVRLLLSVAEGVSV